MKKRKKTKENRGGRKVLRNKQEGEKGKSTIEMPCLRMQKKLKKGRTFAGERVQRHYKSRGTSGGKRLNQKKKQVRIKKKAMQNGERLWISRR